MNTPARDDLAATLKEATDSLLHAHRAGESAELDALVYGIRLPRVETMDGSDIADLESSLASLKNQLATDSPAKGDSAMPIRLTRLSELGEEAHSVTQALSEDGSWAAWLQHDREAESDRISLRSPGGGVAPLPSALTGNDAFRPRLVSHPLTTRTHLLFARVMDGRSEVVHLDVTTSDGAESADLLAARISEPSASAFNVEGVVDQRGVLHVVYQATHHGSGEFGIYYQCMTPNGDWSSPSLVSSLKTGGNCWDPAIAVSTEGTLYVAWCWFQQGGYRIYLAAGSADDWLISEVPSDRDRHSLHPSLAVDEGSTALLAFDELLAPGHGGSGDTAYIESSALAGGRPGVDDPTPLYGARCRTALVAYHEGTFTTWEVGDGPGDLRSVATFPSVAIGGDGRAWLARRVRRPLPFAHYVTYLELGYVDGGRWTPVAVLSDSDGGYSESQVVPTSDAVAVIWQGEGYLDRYRNTVIEDLGQLLQGNQVTLPEVDSEVREHLGLPMVNAIASGHHAGAGVVTSAALTADFLPPIERAGTAFNSEPLSGLAPRHDPPDEDVPSASQEPADSGEFVGKLGGGLQLYWGDLHRHANVSRCSVGLDLEALDQYKFSEDVLGLDFWALTEHAEGASDFSWQLLKKIARLFYRPGHHVPLVGFEWTSFEHGHYNVIYRDDDGPIFGANSPTANTPAKLWNLLGDRDALTIPHHPAALAYPTNWHYFDPRYVKLIEVFQAATGSYESPWCHRQFFDAVIDSSSVQSALNAGRRIGLIGSTDHRYGVSYVGVLTAKLDREEVFDALNMRRCFASTTRGLIPLLRIGEAVMGEEWKFGDLAGSEVQFGALGRTELASVELIRDGEVVAVADLPGNSNQIGVDIRVRAFEGAARGLSGTIEISDGAQLVETAYVDRSAICQSASRYEWDFRLPDRRGIRNPPGVLTFGVTVEGDPSATFSVSVGETTLTTTLAQFVGDIGVSAHGPKLSLEARRGRGGLTGLGQKMVVLAADDDVIRPGSWYYVRAIQVDGEVCWSSPIWID